MKHGTRSTIVAVLATAALLSPLTDVAEAAKKRTERFRLIDPTGVSEAKGKVRVQVRRNKETVRIRLSRLVPGTTYEVRDADTAELLGEVTANRKGKARLNVKRQLSPVVPGKRAGDPTTAVSVLDGETERVVLLGDAEQGSFADALESAGFADAVYVDPRGSRATVTTFSDGFGHGFFELDLFVYDGGNERTPYRASMDSLGDRGMPELLDDVEQLAGRPFDIVDAAQMHDHSMLTRIALRTEAAAEGGPVLVISFRVQLNSGLLQILNHTNHKS